MNSPTDTNMTEPTTAEIGEPSRLSQFRDENGEVSGMIPDEHGRWVSYGSWLRLRAKLEAAEADKLTIMRNLSEILFDKNKAEATIKAIGELHVFDGDKLVEAFHGDYVSPDDFVSASELQAIIKGGSGSSA